MNRRYFITTASCALLISNSASAKEEFQIMKTKSEWKEILTPAQYAVLREHSTERPFTNSLMGESSSLLDEKREGTYICAGCKNELYSSATKYDSGTGWPSFYADIEGGVGYKKDWKLIVPRTEVHCADCGGHLGHVFNDGPKPTGKRHCINGLALLFKEKST